LTPFDIEFEQRLGRLTYVPVHELAHHAQRLMLISHDKMVSALTSVFVENLRMIIQQANGLAERSSD
jgi:hypothetical protein